MMKGCKVGWNIDRLSLCNELSTLGLGFLLRLPLRLHFFSWRTCLLNPDLRRLGVVSRSFSSESSVSYAFVSLFFFCFFFCFFFGLQNFLWHVWNFCLTSENGKKNKRCLCCVGRRLWQERICCGCSELRLSMMERFVVAILRWSRWCPPGKFDTYSAIETSWRRFGKMALRHLVEQVCVYVCRTFVLGTLW
jgi:hypothetical protein